jgi:uncharacterized protein YpbB
MNVSYRSLILLYCINQVNSERSIYGIYHILTGKKSSQALTDGEFYQLSHLFSVMKKLTRNELLNSIEELTSKGLIEMVDQNKYIPTLNGFKLLEIGPMATVPFVDGRKYYDIGIQFWKKLSLLIQVLSNLLRENKEYITIQQDQSILNWTKNYLLSKLKDKHEISREIHTECERCLSQLSEKEAAVFVLKLSSVNRIGWTNKQIASYLLEDETYIEFLFLNVIHFILMSVENDPRSFPRLFEILSTISKLNYSLTESTNKTYQLLSKGKTLDEITMIRNLKRSTIEDHIVEIAHHVEHFSITPFVSSEQQELIIATKELINTLRLKKLKDAIESDVSYFELRLVLAKSGVKNES